MNDVQRNVLIRYSAPTKFCSAVWGQIWKCMHDNDEYSLYIQVSRNPEEPIWLKMGDFLEKAFANRIFDETFITPLLQEIDAQTPSIKGG